MKKTLKTLLLTLLFLIALALFSNVKANSISKIYMDIYVDSYGTAHVTESWKCSASKRIMTAGISVGTASVRSWQNS